MASSTLDRIAALYSELIPDSPGFRLDKKMSKYWSNAIDKAEKSYDDFTDFVVHSTDYANHARRIFVDVYYELSACLPESADVHNMFEDMMATTQRKAISRLDMRMFIVRTDMFAQGCADQVDRLYTALTGKPADASIRQTFLTRFLNDATGTYSIDKMQEDMSTKPKEDLPPQPTIAPPPSKETGVYMNVVDVYEEVMNRPMSAREFLLFSKELLDASTHGEHKRQAIGIKDKFTATFLKVKEVVHKYLDEDMSEIVFIRNHLARSLSAPETAATYEDQLKTEIVMGGAYAQKMKQKISELHQQMYGDDMNQADCDFLFERFRVLRLELVNEDMNQMIGQFRKETDDIVQTVYDIFMQVYEREPDEEELDSHVSYIRVHGENAIAMIKSQLRGALEYHDVLKRKIKKVHGTVRADPILPSQVFKILNRVLAHKDHMESDDIETVIQGLI